jgi:transposase
MERNWTTVELKYLFKQSERWSVLLAITINGYLSYTIFQDAFTSTLFENWLQNDVLPFCTAHPGPNSVLIIDNASIHRSHRVKELCARSGVVVEYLPPYSLDLNSIERSFKNLKS